MPAYHLLASFRQNRDSGCSNRLRARASFCVKSEDRPLFHSRSFLANTLAQNSKWNHVCSVRIGNRLGRLCAPSIRCAGMVITLAICASAIAADPSKNVVIPAQPKPVVKTTKKICYTFTSASAIPVRCDRIGPIPTTASPMDIYGHSSIHVGSLPGFDP